MRVEKKKKERRKHNKRRNTKQQTKKTRPRTTVKKWYDNQVCYGPMRPTYHIHRYTCVDEKTRYVAKEGAQGTTPHAKKNDEPPRTSKSMPANTNHNHISPIFFPP